MPRVGSSKMIAFGFIASHLASTTFCWLPPDSDDVSWPTSAVRMSRSERLRFGLRDLGIPRNQAAACVGAQVRQRDVLRDREVEQQAGALAVLGHEKDAGVDRIGGGREMHRLAVERDATRHRPVDAEQGAGEFGAAGADQAGQSEDLAGAEVEVDLAAGIGGGAQALHGKDRLAAGRRRRHVVDLQIAADHQPDHRVVVDLRAFERADQPAVAQHDDAVGGLDHLVQPVRDEDDRDAVRP